jgi:glycine cleavage system protein P-like pyridoxal-binding family
MAYFNSSQIYISQMLREIGVSSIDDLFRDIPAELLLKHDLKLDSALAEWEVKEYFHKLSLKNNYRTNNFKGAGAYQHYVPALVRHLSSRGEFLTSYTPYQPEVSQGTLRAIYMFQSFMADICGMDLANASMYDGATALAESLCMAHRIHKKRKIYLSKSTHPEYIEVAENYLEALGLEIIFFEDLSQVENSSIISIPNPNFYGELLSHSERLRLSEEIKSRDLFLIVSTSEPFALFMDKKLKDLGVEIVCGSAQSFGNPVFYGGAQVGFISSKLEHVRQMPGRLVGKTTDRKGNTGYALTFQAREQHIKRDRASSNICTNQSIHALCVAIYLSMLGISGVEKIIQDCYLKSQLIKNTLEKFPEIKVFSENTFNEFMLQANFNAVEKRLGLEAANQLQEYLNSYLVSLSKFKTLTGRNLIPERLLKNFKQSEITKPCEDLSNSYLLAITEINSIEHLKIFIRGLNQILASSIEISFSEELYIKEASDTHYQYSENGITETVKYLPKIDPKNYKFESKTELDVCRYFTKLSQKNFSIDTNFYPLGSCTMKYNPKVNDDIASGASWTGVHPYEDEKNIQGVLKVYEELNQSLCEITGFDSFSLQSAAGAQGEFSALLMAKKYFNDKGTPERNIVLVPDSAHGTNPASAVMAGFKVISVRSAADGDVNLEHLNELCTIHSKSIGVFMLTNPNTLGIFSKRIQIITKTIHEHGGLMYYDGANLNAIVGTSRPGDMGFDLIHLNVHKTFSTPHGGGGPGAGPVGAKGELVKYLPSPYLVKDTGGNLKWDKTKNESIGRIRSFHGNFNVLIRALTYIKSNGKEGISQIGQIATLNANYLQEKIRKSPILSEEGLFSPYFNEVCKHEFIISASKLKEKYGISALDIAKNLLDKGIHAPTIYFPTNINECIMIEPTETESRESLDALVLALEEIITLAKTESGRELIKTAPHTTEFSRFDEVKAVKEPVLSWMMEALK